MGRYEDNFVNESLDILMDQGGAEDERRRRINRRDAARAAVETNKSKARPLMIKFGPHCEDNLFHKHFPNYIFLTIPT
jgi:hypothetical protein